MNNSLNTTMLQNDYEADSAYFESGTPRSGYSDSLHSDIEIETENVRRDQNIQGTTDVPFQSYSKTLASIDSSRSCRCSINILSDIKKLRGFPRLDALNLFLDACMFHLPFEGYLNIHVRENLKSCKSVSDLHRGKDKREIKPYNCISQCHTISNTKSIYQIDDIVLKIKSARRKNDMKTIRELFILSLQNNVSQLYDTFCVEKPYHDSVSHIIVETVKKRFFNFYKTKMNILHIWVGYKAQEMFLREGRQRKIMKAKGIDTLVVVVEQCKKTDIEDFFMGLNLLIVFEHECNNEAEKLLRYDFCHSTETELMHLNECDVAELFRNHTNISLINYSNIRCRGYKSSSYRVEKVPTIVIHCHVKGVIPIGEKMFPNDINGLLVDVREGTCSLSVNKLRLGERIFAEDISKLGTLGGFVDLQNPSRKAMLTCAHVVLPSNILQFDQVEEYIRKKEIIPVFDKDKRKIGKVIKAVFNHGRPNNVSVDAALVEITDRYPCDGFFSDVFSENQLNGAGFSEDESLHFAKGQIERINMFNFRKQIIKIGASSGITLGCLRIGRSSSQIINDHEVNIENGFKIQLFGQLEVMPMIDPSQPSDSRQTLVDDGDSGALVFAITTDNPVLLKCIGIIVAKTSYGSGLITPIDKVFDALGLPYNSFSKFPLTMLDQTSDSEGLHSMLISIAQQLTAVQSSMATKHDIQNTNESLGRNISETNANVERLKRDLERFNDRLAMTEDNIDRLGKHKLDDGGK